MSESLVRWFLGSYFTIYFGVCFVWRSYLVWRRTGINPLVLGKSDSVYDYVGRLFKITISLIALTVVVYLSSNDWYSLLVPIAYLEIDHLKVLGMALSTVALIWISIAQAQMGASWRIGIDHKNKTGLVANGLFKLSRNPIFLGMIVSIFGLFFLLPNALTLLVMVLGTVLIQIQVRLEEEFLARTHGKDYETFRNTVRRWL